MRIEKDKLYLSDNDLHAFILARMEDVYERYTHYRGGIVAKHFGVPVVFAKKSKSVNIDGEMYVAEVESFTHKCKNQVIVSKKFLTEDDHVLIIDDFLANGCALQGLISIVQEAGGTVEGIGIAIEKGFQSGGKIIRNLGYQLESLAIIDGMDASTGDIFFRQQ